MARKKKGGGRAKLLATLIVAAFIILAILPTALVVAVGFVPSVAALIFDTTRGRYLARCVAGLNLAGVAPFVASLWANGNTVGTAVGIIGDPFAWLSFYGCAGVGWLMFLWVPLVVASVQQGAAAHRLDRLRAKQERLTKEWGDSIAANTKGKDGGAAQEPALPGAGVA